VSYTTHIALGSNLSLESGPYAGDRLSHLQFGVDRIAALDSLTIESISSVYETEAHIRPGSEPQSPYLNAVIRCRSGFDAPTLLHLLLSIEQERGRTRKSEVTWEARTLDLDIIDHNGLQFHDENLDLPHPRLAERRFVLVPTAEITPDLFLPAPFEANVVYLLETCPDTSDFHRTPHKLRIPEGK